MRQIILNLAVTLDGFIEGPNGEIDWINPGDGSGSESFFEKFLADIDTILYGRISYDLWGNYQPGPDAAPPERKLWDNVHSKKKYVFSRTAKPDGKATFVQDNIVTQMNDLRKQPGKNIWLYGGANLITDFINQDLVDSYLLGIFPVILGSGKPLFTNISKRVDLELKSVEPSPSGMMLVRYDRK